MNYLHFSKKRLLAFLAAASCLFAAEVQAQGNSVKTNPTTKSNTKNGCEYQTISGLAEVVSIEKVVPKDSSILEYDEYSVKFKFIPKEGGQLMSTFRDQELDFYLTAQGETFNVGPQYLRQYQIRKNTKYSMRILQGPLCPEKLKFDNMAGGVGLPNDVFEAEKNVGKIKEWKAAQLLVEKETAFADAHPDLVPEEEKTPTELSEEEKARKAAEEAAAKEAEEARIKRETEFMLKEQELARKAAGLDNTDPDDEGNPDENTTISPDGGNPDENPTPTDTDPTDENPATADGGDEPAKYSSTATVTRASTTNTANPDSTTNEPTKTDSASVTENPNGGNGIDEEALRAEVAAQVAKELEEKRIREEKLAAEKKAKEDAARKKEEERLAKIKAKEDEKRRKEEEKLKKEEDARIARQREIEEQQRKAQEERIKKDLADKIRQDMLKEAEEKAKAEAEAKAKAEEEAKIAAEKKAQEEAKAAEEKKAQEDEVKRGECTYQTKIAGTIQVTSVKKINTSEESRLGYAEYEVKVKFTPSSADDLPKNTKKMFESEYTFVIDAQGKSANPSAAYIKKYSVNPNARFNGFAQVLNAGICNQVIFFSKDLPIDPAQTNLK